MFMNRIFNFSANSKHLWLLLAACASLVAGAQRTAAQSAGTLAIPGAITLSIQPAEAISDGARWTVDGGTPQVSGASVTNLAPGRHTIRFSNLPGWLEPALLDVLVIGGKQAAVAATYRPLPRFYFRAVPEQRP